MNRKRNPLGGRRIVWKDFLNKGSPVPDTGPPGPEKQGGRRGKSLRWIFFFVLVLYILLAAYHVQILQGIGRFLVVEHAPSKSDVIVCLAGSNIERALGAADLYHNGLAPRIFIAPDEPPDGYDLVRSKGIQYPQNIDLMVMLLQKLDVPKSAILAGEKVGSSTKDEAEIVRELVEREKYRSLILVTSPTHSRRTYLTFTSVLKDQDIRIQVVPTPYSNFRAENWWEHRKYVRQVLQEYAKLAYYYLRGLS
jgi:uncharacterized SAM-binding protein YcdF (DUF218 family)